MLDNNEWRAVVTAKFGGIVKAINDIADTQKTLFETLKEIIEN